MSKKDEWQEMIHAWERLWKSRDLELQFQWQRSIFLSAFMLLLFTGYGYVLFKFASDDISKDGRNLLHLIAFIVSFMGVVFSLLWIMMAKGSKFWYEAYEGAIGYFNNIYKPSYLHLPHAVEDFVKTQNCCLFTTDCYRFSPSRINILLGQITIIIWFIACIVHLIFIYAVVIEKISCTGIGHFELLLFLLIITCLLVLTFCIIKKISSMVRNHSTK